MLVSPGSLKYPLHFQAPPFPAVSVRPSMCPEFLGEGSYESPCLKWRLLGGSQVFEKITVL